MKNVEKIGNHGALDGFGGPFFSSDTTQQQKNLTAKYILFPRRLPANLKMCGGTALGSGFAGADLVI
jgi:hypothetical protein